MLGDFSCQRCVNTEHGHKALVPGISRTYSSKIPEAATEPVGGGRCLRSLQPTYNQKPNMEVKRRPVDPGQMWLRLSPLFFSDSAVVLDSKGALRSDPYKALKPKSRHRTPKLPKMKRAPRKNEAHSSATVPPPNKISHTRVAEWRLSVQSLHS